jgi:hypothetical protein
MFTKNFPSLVPSTRYEELSREQAFFSRVSRTWVIMIEPEKECHGGRGERRSSCSQRCSRRCSLDLDVRKLGSGRRAAWATWCPGHAHGTTRQTPIPCGTGPSLAPFGSLLHRQRWLLKEQRMCLRGFSRKLNCKTGCVVSLRSVLRLVN